MSAQSLNFRDTIGLAKLLCSKEWYCYRLNPDSSFSDKIIDTIRFFPNKTWRESRSPICDSTSYWDKAVLSYLCAGKWYFGSTGRVRRSDSSSNFITLNVEIYLKGTAFFPYLLVDGHAIKESINGKSCGNLDGPFILAYCCIRWDKRFVFQPRRQITKPKNH